MHSLQPLVSVNAVHCFLQAGLIAVSCCLLPCCSNSPGLPSPAVFTASHGVTITCAACSASGVAQLIAANIPGLQPAAQDQVSDFCRCVPYLLYYGDVSEEAFGLLVEEMRPFGVRVVAYPRRNDLKHLEARGVIGFFMCPGDGPGAWTECM